MTIEPDNQFVKNAIDATVKIALLAAMAVISFKIIQPFFMPVLWAIIIAVALGPIVEKLIKILGGDAN